MILSFGIFYPPLAFLGLFAMALDTVIVQIEIGRLIDRREMFDQETFAGIMSVLNNECHGLTSLIRRLNWAPSFYCIWIYIFVLFDTMSDTEGNDNGYLVAFTWLGFVLIFKGIRQVYFYYQKLFNRDDKANRLHDNNEISSPLEHRVSIVQPSSLSLSSSPDQKSLNIVD